MTSVLPSSPAGRIKLLLGSSEVSDSDLAAVLELPSGTSISDVLSGNYELTATDLAAVADLLDLPVTVLTGQVAVDRHLGVSLRLGSVAAADVPTAALEYADKLLGYRALLDSWFGQVASPLSGIDMSTDRYRVRGGRESARRVRDALDLGDQPVFDLVGLVESTGVPVAFLQLPKDVHGLNIRDEREGTTARAIIVSTADLWTRQRYTLAHELCHALYDDEGQVIVDRVEVPDILPELRAESFARHLLLPSEALTAEVGEARRLGTSWESIIARLMVRWGMSRAAVVRALVDESLVADHDMVNVVAESVERLMARSGLAEQWRSLSANQRDESGSPWLVNKAVEAFGNGWVSVRVVADLLGQDVESAERELAKQGWSA